MTNGHRGWVGIGQVLAELRGEFPDISPSKIRFLEAEGLISPARAESGYRRFAVADIERLRYILTVQRDEYLDSLRRLQTYPTRMLLPAHGPPTLREAREGSTTFVVRIN